jgi:hypothetical protein
MQISVRLLNTPRQRHVLMRTGGVEGARLTAVRPHDEQFAAIGPTGHEFALVQDFLLAHRCVAHVRFLRDECDRCGTTTRASRRKMREPALSGVASKMRTRTWANVSRRISQTQCAR